MEILWAFLLAPIPGMALAWLLFKWWTGMDPGYPQLPPETKRRRLKP